MKVSIRRPVQHLSYSSDHLNVAEAVIDVHERIVVRVSKTDIGIWVDGAKAVQFLPQSTLDPHYYDTEPDKPEKRPTKKRVPPDPEGAKRRMELDPVSALWAGVYENFRNIVKNFWRELKVVITVCLSALAGFALAKGFDGVCVFIVVLIVFFSEVK